MNEVNESIVDPKQNDVEADSVYSMSVMKKKKFLESLDKQQKKEFDDRLFAVYESFLSRDLNRFSRNNTNRAKQKRKTFVY